MKNNVDKSWNNYNIVKVEMEKALNEYASIIYNVPLGSISQDNLKDYTDELQKILQNEVHQLDILFKNENKVKELNIYARPDDFYNVIHTINPDDTTAKNYMPNYSLY
jgi:predicted DNA-binding ArsR family transcriptional regulator